MTFLLIAALTTTSFPQMAGDGAKSQGIQPGAPAGSYTLTDFENLNVYNGNLNFSLPLVKIGGRGRAQSSVNLTIDSMRWQLDHDVPTRDHQILTWGAQYQHYLLAGATTATVNCRREDVGGDPGQPIYQFVCDEFQMSDAIYLDLSFFSEVVGPPGVGGVTYDIYPTACGRKPGYGPGVVMGQGVKMGLVHGLTLTRLTFIAPDGTEIELRDTLTGGEPKMPAANQQIARGRVFASAGSEGMVFVADEPIFDVITSVRARCPYSFYPAGFLYFSDGTKYRVNSNGDIESISDSNGNLLSYIYDSSHRVTQITDSLNRQVVFTYDNVASNPNETYDDIKYKSTDVTWRHVKVYRTSLGNTLRSGFTISSLANLFGDLPGLPSDLYNPTGMATRVELPDENRSYRIYYNPYGVVARVEVPTGGAIEYDRDNPDLWGFVANEPLVQRRVYAEGGSSFLNTTPDQKQVYSRSKALDSNQRPIVNVTVENRAKTPSPATGILTEQLQSKEVHSYYGWPDLNRQGLYGPWREGLEFRSEVYAPNSTTPLRRLDTEWEQPIPVKWITQTQANQAPDKMPVNNPRVISVTTSIMDVSPSLVSKQVYGYDDSPAFRAFNNKTDVWEYAYGEGAASNQLLRHTQTKYLITDTSPSPTPTPSPEPSPTPDECRQCPCVSNCLMRGSSGPAAQEYARQNLIRLPAELRVFQGLSNNQEQLQARTEYVYDETSLLSCDNVTGWTDPVSLARGNLTTTKKWINPADDNAFVGGSAKYDIAGNIVETTDANGNVTSISFDDRFGSADGNVQNYVSMHTYAFPTRVTDAMGHSASTKYDFYTGAPVTRETANGVKANLIYADSLGRVTQVIEEVGTSLQRQTSFNYDDAGHIVTTTSDVHSFGDDKLKTKTVYDGMARTIETDSYESTSSYIMTRQFYDGLGRVIKASNPYRTTGDSTYGEVETSYDALGRVVKVTNTNEVANANDDATVTTAYVGNTVTVTDQAGKQRKSVKDALGRLISVYEAPNDTNYNYQTSYTYDALDRLIAMTQGAQTRTFAYDSLSRLTSETNPESGTVLYSYDANGNLIGKSDPRELAGTSTHVTTNCTYDALNRATKRIYNDGTPEVTYYYDAQALPTGAPAIARGASIGHVLAITYGGSTSINGTYFGYNNIGLTNKSAQVTNGQTFPTMEYGYSLTGSLTWQKYPSGREVTAANDDAGRLNSVSGVMSGETPRTYISMPQFTAHGSFTEVKLGNGLWERTTFNARLQPTLIKLGTESNPENMLKLSYSYGMADNNGNVKSQTITVPAIGAATAFTATQSYEYDPLNRLKSAQEISGTVQNWKQTYNYDQYGNRRLYYTGGATTTPIEPTSQTVPIYNPEISPANNNRLVGYEYDLAGNVTRDAQNRTFSYDADNHQLAYNGGAVINSADSASYNYDGDGKRVRKQIGGSMTVTVYVYNIAGQIVAEYTDSPNPRSAQTSYVTTDTLGSTRLVTGQDQAIKARFDYLPYGEEIGAQWGRTSEQKYNASVMRQRFTQYERDDEAGLDFAQARYYSHRHGRFTSPDPYGKSAFFLIPQSWNKYSYCINNPLNYVDPSGMIWLYDSERSNAHPLYVWVSPNDYKKGNMYFDNKDRWEVQPLDRIGPNGETFRLLEGDFAEMHPDLVGQEVYLGEDGDLHALYPPLSDDTPKPERDRIEAHNMQQIADMIGGSFKKDAGWGIVVNPNISRAGVLSRLQANGFSNYIDWHPAHWGGEDLEGRVNGTWHHIVVGYSNKQPGDTPQQCLQRPPGFFDAFNQRHFYRPSGMHRVDWFMDLHL